MSLSCGLVGLPLSGKTTIFNLLTKANAVTSSFYSGKTDTNQGTTFIPDSRIDYLTELYKPQKKIYAKIDYKDLPGLNREIGSQRKGGNQFLSGIRHSDALVYVLRAFEDGDIEHIDGTIDPLRDWNSIEMELLIADLDIIEKNIEKITQGKKITRENQVLLEALQRCQDALENGTPIQTLDFSEEEQQRLQGFSFFTGKPYLVLVNVDERQLHSSCYPQAEALKRKAETQGVPLIELCAKVEAEINQLTHEDRATFMGEMGISESGISKLAKVTYELLNLLSFFTVGEDEVRAWTIEKGTTAKKAAGKIHSDIEKGFIRAEVMKFHDIFDYGAAQKVREQGLCRLEGKEYVVQDGDIINFRFNV